MYVRLTVPQIPPLLHSTYIKILRHIAEGMYPSEEDKPVRWESLHMTFSEVATLARDGGAHRLWLTHVGTSLEDPPAHLGRATAIFPGAVVGHDRLTETLVFKEE